MFPTTSKQLGAAGPQRLGTRLKLVADTVCLANAGAALALVYNTGGFTDRMVMEDTDLLPIPGVFLSNSADDVLMSKAR